jgi:hypothetical protein
MKYKLFISIYILAILNVLRLFYFDESTICGQDKLMNINSKLEYANYPVVKFKLKENHNNLFDYMTKKFESLIDHPKSVFRRNLLNKKKFCYSTEPTEKIISYTFSKIESIDKTSKQDVVNLAMNNKNKLKFCIANDGYIVAFSHLFLDGVTSYNTTTYITDDPNPVEVKNYHYIPIYNEILILYGLLKLIKMGIPKRHLSLDYPRDKSHYHNILKTKIPLSIIKKLKNKSKISFSIVFSAIQTLAIFNSTIKDKISVGVVIAFNNKNRFNNFTAIALEIERPKNIVFTENNIIDFIINFNNKIKERLYMIYLFYSITNIYNLNFSVNKTIDVLISGLPMCLKQQHSIDNIEISDVFGTMPYHTCPVYIFHLSDTKYIYTSQHFRTNDIDKLKLEKFNNDLLNF